MRTFVYYFMILIFIVVSMPFQLIIGMFIIIVSGFPVIFRQKRIGRGGKPFIMYKFRTMRRGAESEQKRLSSKNESDGPVFKLYNDPRFTSFGKFLAHTGLDELPQLYNVLRGDMALFGPRPLPVHEAVKLRAWQKKRHDIMPGILSPAIITGKYHEDFDEWMKSDIAYSKNKRFWYDIALAGQAVLFLLRLVFSEMTHPRSGK